MTSSSMVMRSLRPLACLAWFVFTCMMKEIHAYPVIVQVDEDTERCFRFNIPEDDDAHFVAVAIPNEDEIEDEDFELWYVEQVFKMTKYKDNEEDNSQQLLPRKIPDEQPEKVAKQYGFYLQQTGSNKSNLQVKITRTPSSRPDEFHYISHAKYFLPTVVNQVRRTTRNRRMMDPNTKKREARPEEDDLEGYGVCFTNGDQEKQINVVFDIVYVNERVVDEEDAASLKKDRHLTPLEESLDMSIAAANAVVKEMNYMEQREKRMKETAENINNRVHYLSYLSIAVLLVVTYIQVSYLKRYFTKKKLM